MKTLRTILLILVSMAMINGCSSIRYVPTETKEIINYIDSLVIRDSTVIIPIERIRDVVPVYDTLKLETSMAMAEAYVDSTTHTLKGSIENKKGSQSKVRYIDRVAYRDTTIIKEIPVEVPVPEKYIPRFYRDCMCGFFVLLVLVVGYTGLKLYFKFK